MTKIFEHRANHAVCHASAKGHPKPRTFIGVVRVDRFDRFWIKILPDSYETGEGYYPVELEPRGQS